MRCYVLDPVCAVTFGHSLNALHYFSNMAGRRWSEVVPIASRHLPYTEEERDERICRYFDFYYDQHITINHVEELDDRSFISKRNAEPQAVANYDFSNFLYYWNVSRKDAVILPSVDFYSCIALFNALENLPEARIPALFLRFIGVLEYGGRPDQSGMLSILDKVRRFREGGGRISVAAETPKLARKLTNLLGFRVETTPYPMSQDQVLPLSENGPFTVLCGGSARGDKGFFRLSNIISEVNRSAGLEEIQFIVQGQPTTEMSKNYPYNRSLYAKPNVEILDGILTYEAVVRSFASSHITLMPYDKETYSERGSAILMESLLFGRLVVGQAHTAFAEQIRLYSCGEVCDSDTDFASVICMMRNIDRSFLKMQSELAQLRYLSDVNRSYSAWLGAIS